MEKYRRPECPPHKPSGETCLSSGVAEFNADGTPAEPCFVCLDCGHYIRPEKYEDDCRRCKEAENLANGRCHKGHPAEPDEKHGFMKCDICKQYWGGGVLYSRYS